MGEHLQRFQSLTLLKSHERWYFDRFVLHIISAERDQHAQYAERLSPQLQFFSAKAKAWLEQELKKLVGPIKLDFPSKIRQSPLDDVQVYAGMDIILLPNLPIVDEDLKEYAQAQLLLQLLHSGSAPYYFSARSDGPETEFILERRGVSPTVQRKSQIPFKDPAGSFYIGDALEIGLSHWWQHKAGSLIRAEFPAGAERYAEYFKGGIKAEGGIPVVIGDNNIVYRLNEEGQFYLGDTIPDSLRLILFLSTNITNFIPLLERARLFGETLLLARKIISVFGEKAYRSIMITKEEDTPLLIKQLKQLKNLKKQN